jgi:hypothetical protein
MMRFKGWAMTAGLVLAASAANAQMPAPNDTGRSSYRSVSDFDGPYAAMPPPPPAPPPVYNYGGGYYGPPLMPPQEVYAVLRDNGFSPLGVPHQRGMVYFIAVVDRGGNDGRLVIDARDGRILRFVPSYGYGPGPYVGPFGPDRLPGYGPETSLPPPTVIRGGPRPPASIPNVASRAVPLPSPKPAVAVTGNSPPAPPQQSAAVETKPATAPAAAQAPASAPPSAQASVASSPSTTTVGQAKPQPAIQPTQAMPAAQGLE